MLHVRPPILTAAALLAFSLMLRPAVALQPTVQQHACVEGEWHGDLLVPPKSSDLMPQIVPSGSAPMPNVFPDTPLSGSPAKSLL